MAKLAKELLPAIDNLDRAVQAALSAPSGDAEEADDARRRASSRSSSPGSDSCTPTCSRRSHASGSSRSRRRASRSIPSTTRRLRRRRSPDAESGTVVEVYQAGYRIGETVLRPARVLVAA